MDYLACKIIDYHRLAGCWMDVSGGRMAICFVNCSNLLSQPLSFIGEIKGDGHVYYCGGGGRVSGTVTEAKPFRTPPASCQINMIHADAVRRCD